MNGNGTDAYRGDAGVGLGPLCRQCGEHCMDRVECSVCDGTGKVQDTRDWSLGGLIYMEMSCINCFDGLAWEPTCDPHDDEEADR